MEASQFHTSQEDWRELINWRRSAQESVDEWYDWEYQCMMSTGPRSEDCLACISLVSARIPFSVFLSMELTLFYSALLSD